MTSSFNTSRSLWNKFHNVLLLMLRIFGGNVCFIKICSKHNSVLLLCLLQFFMKQTLICLLMQKTLLWLPDVNDYLAKFAPLSPRKEVNLLDRVLPRWQNNHQNSAQWASCRATVEV